MTGYETVKARMSSTYLQQLMLVHARQEDECLHVVQAREEAGKPDFIRYSVLSSDDSGGYINKL